jgi:hypothetical protein
METSTEEYLRSAFLRQSFFVRNAHDPLLQACLTQKKKDDLKKANFNEPDMV